MSNYARNPETTAREAGDETRASLARDLFSFSGRIRLRKFWLMVIIISLAWNAVEFIGSVFIFGPLLGSPRESNAALAALMVVTIPLYWMGLAISTKRWHDRGKSAWWNLILIIPIIGWIWVLVELGFLGGDSEENRYGREDVSSVEIVSKWTFWTSLAFIAVLFSGGTWVGSGNEPIVGWRVTFYAVYIRESVQILWLVVGSLIIWLMSRR